MMKHFKKLTLVTTAAFLFLLTAVTETSALLPVPGITMETDIEEDIMPEEPEIGTLADDDENENGENEKKKVY